MSHHSSASANKPLSLDALNAESSRLRSKIASEIQEADDPLALYDSFVKWIFDEYPREHLASSGLIELLEEATRRYMNDSSYKSDLRYLKLWTLYASLVDKPSVVYKFILTNGIGTVYALLFEDYALTLERDGRHSAAREVYRAGIQRKARPIERLKKKFDMFQRRTSSKPPIPPPAPQITLPKVKGTAEADLLRKQPLKNYSNSNATKQSQPTSVLSSRGASEPSSTSSHTRYSYMLSPQPSGKRPEKLRLHLHLLFTEEGGEYSMPEARARSMGLLGKKWGPPPASELSSCATSSTTRVNFNDDGAKSTRNYTARRSLAGAEPTVTINTKAALADVFGMYNSPEKSTRISNMPGTKHAPVRAVEPVTSSSLLPQTRLESVEKASHLAAPPSEYQVRIATITFPLLITILGFTPFVDENACRKENPPKFKPFVDANLQTRPPAPASMSARRALASKDIGITASTPMTKGTGDGDKPNVFSKVFTPVTKEEIKQPVDYPPESESQLSQVQNEAPKPCAQKLSLLGDAQGPFKVFSRPPEQDNVFSRPDCFGRTPLATFVPQRKEILSEDEDDQEDEDVPPNATVDCEEGIEDFETAHDAPFGGRFGQFNVMTPITERTLEYTSTGRFSVPDGDVITLAELGERPFEEPDAIEAAERLAAEVREDNVFSDRRVADYHRIHNSRDHEGSSSSSLEEPLFSRPPPFRTNSEFQAAAALVEEKTGSLNLSDEVFNASTFNPPNPCNPFDPPIVSTLLSFLPTDPGCHHVPQESHLLEDLQKFARKQMRTSGGSSRSSDHGLTFSLQLGDTHFGVYGKLGEGGFGAVFSAKAKSRANNDMDEDDDTTTTTTTEESHRVAIKVVKPGNAWEFRMLRKVHADLPARLRPSVIRPQALYTFDDESFLILDLCKQGSLLDIINRAGTAGISQQGACLDELLVMFFTIELLRLLEGLHDTAGVIHGDLKIDNCLVRLEDVVVAPTGGSSSSAAWAAQYDPSGGGGWSSKGIKLIDFGRAVDTRMFPRGQAFVAEWATDARDCVEMREGRPWTYQADYFGLAGIVFCMLYGKYIEASSVVRVAPQQQSGQPRYKLAAAFKRYWQVDLWTRLFDVLLNPCLVRPDGALPVSDTLAELRVEMETWLRANCNRSSNTLKGLLKKIELSVIRGD
ncbi:hypothetical protein F5148DRAFT_1373397 [Russula earlei]|uniref:Uncharacterized protein n=1 Tax=Russula earlei TaxID=71964 RepID=A0ACC0UK83_9AGAM|nr:hypothetical protein F5148DRAFT_1373397 [Russula earlei]